MYTDATFVREAPLLWNKEKIYAMKGQSSVIMRILYENPCSSIKKFIEMEELIEPLTTWCNRALTTDFIEPIDLFCKTEKVIIPNPNTQMKARHNPVPEARPINQYIVKHRAHRRKRGFAAVLIVAAVVNVGISAISMTTSAVNSFSLSRVRAIQADLLAQAKKATDNDNNTKKALLDIEHSISLMTKVIEVITNELYAIKENYPQVMYLIAQLTSRLQWTQHS